MQGKISLPQYLVCALTILLSPIGKCTSRTISLTRISLVTYLSISQSCMSLFTDPEAKSKPCSSENACLHLILPCSISVCCIHNCEHSLTYLMCKGLPHCKLGREGPHLLPAPGLQDLGCQTRDQSDGSLIPEGDDIGKALASLPATWSWWACRAIALQQRMLLGLSSSLRSATSILLPEVCLHVFDHVVQCCSCHKYEDCLRCSAYEVKNIYTQSLQVFWWFLLFLSLSCSWYVT